VALCAALYLPGFFAIPAIDRDEARFAQASRQMAAAADWRGWIIPAVQERPRLQKPPLIYWLQATSARVFTDRWRGLGSEAVQSDSIWMYRLPSLLSAASAVLMTWRWALALFDRRAALMAGALMAANPLMFWEARQARADMLLLACTAMAMWASWEVVRRARFGRTSGAWVAGFWCAVAAGILTKGPITPLVVGLGVVVHAVVRGELRLLTAFRPWIGIPCCVLPVAVWIWAVSDQIKLSEYLTTIKTETINRGLVAMEGHGGPAGFHVVALYIVFLPACMAVALGVWRAVERGFVSESGSWERSLRGRFRQAIGAVRTARAGAWPECFLVCMLFPGWIMFEVSGTKLPHYTLPLYPVLAILAARGVHAGRKLPGVLTARAGRLIWIWATGCVAFGLFFGTLAVATLWETMWGLGVVVGLACAVASCLIMQWTARYLRPRRIVELQVGGVAWFLIIAVTLGTVAGQTPAIRVSRNLNAVFEAQIDRERPIAAVGWHEDSLIFETHGRSRRIDEWKLKEWLRANDRPGRRALVVLERERLQHWPSMREVSGVTGVNYSIGRRVDLVVAELTRDLP